MKETEKLTIRKKQPVITRHKALLAYLLDKNIIKEGEYNWIEHADYASVEGKDVIGVLPLQLASYAKSITEVPLTLTPEMRGKELTFDEVEKVANPPVQYRVREIDPKDGVDYYKLLLKSYSEEDYKLAYKYYQHSEVSSEEFRGFAEIAKARSTYMDILNCLYGIFDIYTIECNIAGKFEFFRIWELKFRCSLAYDDESKNVTMKEFSRDGVLNFIDELMDMCL